MRVDWIDDFEILYKERGQHKYGIRLLALLKIQKGMTETKVCEFIGKTHATIRAWRKTYESGGVEDLLKIRKGRGRKPRIKNRSDIDEAVKALMAQREGGRIRAEDFVGYFEKERKIKYSVSGMYHLLHRHRYSWITSRSKHPNQDPEAIEDFKKTSKPM